MPPKPARIAPAAQASLRRVAQESAMFSRILQEQCTEANQIMADASRLYGEAMQIVQEGFYVLKQDPPDDKERLTNLLERQHENLITLCDENSRLKLQCAQNSRIGLQLDAATYEAMLLRATLEEAKKEADMLRVALATERSKTRELSDDLIREQRNVDTLMTLYSV